MAVYSSKNITITMPKAAADDVFARLQTLGTVELIEQTENAALSKEQLAIEAELLAQLEVANRAHDALKAYEDKAGLLAFLTDHRIEVTLAEFQESVEKKAALLTVATEISKTHDEQVRLQEEKVQIEQAIHTVTPFKDIDVKIFGSFEFVSFVPFFLNSAHQDIVAAEIQKRFPEAVIETLDKLEDEYVYVVAVAKEDRDDLVSYVMDNATLISVDTTIEGSFRDIYTKSTRRDEEIVGRLAEIDAFFKDKVAEINAVVILKDVLHSDMKRLFAWHAVRHVDAETVAVEGYVSLDAVPALETTLQDIAGVAVRISEKVNPKKVVMRNNWFVKPFEIVTTMMGVPAGNAVDPTPILAFFFVFMYGLSLSEAGYGTVCALITGFLLLKVRKMNPGPKALIQIIFFASVSTMVVGSMFGSWFGVTPWDIDVANPDKYLPHTQFLINIGWWPLAQGMQLFNPIQKILPLMVAMGVLGLFHLLTGLAVGLRQAQRRGELTEGFFAYGSWFVLLVLIVMNVLNLMGFLGASLQDSSILVIVLGVFAIAMVPMVGREASGIIGKFAKGAFDMFFGVIGYVSDILSYTRLVALGLATGIIAAVVNTLAGIAGGGLAGSDSIVKIIIGYAIMLVIFLVGHTFNIGLNVLGSYITVGRLHFVEFFGKFFESGGEELQPFSVSEEFIHIKNN